MKEMCLKRVLLEVPKDISKIPFNYKFKKVLKPEITKEKKTQLKIEIVYLN